jgi:chromosomal replication initiation ATPase DnaA
MVAMSMKVDAMEQSVEALEQAIGRLRAEQRLEQRKAEEPRAKEVVKEK